MDVRKAPKRTMTEFGAALIEGAFSVIMLTFLVGGTIDLGIRTTLMTELQKAAREGARVASFADPLSAGAKAMVRQAVTYRMNRFGKMIEALTVTIPDVDPGGTLVDADGNDCDQTVTVIVEGDQRFSFLSSLMYSSSRLRVSTTMRWNMQPLCD